MDNFLLCLNAILPLLLLMLLGYGLRRSGMISHEGFSAMDKLCFLSARVFPDPPADPRRKSGSRDRHPRSLPRKPRRARHAVDAESV